MKPRNQKWSPATALDYGVSITDPCIGWEETEALLYEAAEAVAATERDFLRELDLGVGRN